MMHSLSPLWQTLDRGELWQQGAAAAQLERQLDEVARRLQRARAAGLTVSESSYLRFMRRTTPRSDMAQLARAG